MAKKSNFYPMNPTARRQTKRLRWHYSRQPNEKYGVLCERMRKRYMVCGME